MYLELRILMSSLNRENQIQLEIAVHVLTHVSVQLSVSGCSYRKIILTMNVPRYTLNFSFLIIKTNKYFIFNSLYILNLIIIYFLKQVHNLKVSNMLYSGYTSFGDYRNTYNGITYSG